MGKTAAIIGATGMIGTYLLPLLLEDDYFSTVRVIVRRPQQKNHPKMEVKLVNFDDAESLKLALEGTDIIFSCIGTTKKTVKGDQQLYRHIDVEIPYKVARFAKEAGCEKFLMVSSVGADEKSNTFYLQLKGEAEEKVRSVGFQAVHVFRPSVLLGDRKQKRTGERIWQAIMTSLSVVIPKKYRAVEGKAVAKSMLESAKQNSTGFFIHTNEEILAIKN